MLLGQWLYVQHEIMGLRFREIVAGFDPVINYAAVAGIFIGPFAGFSGGKRLAFRFGTTVELIAIILISPGVDDIRDGIPKTVYLVFPAINFE